MKKTAYLVTVQPSSPGEKPEQRVYMDVEKLATFLSDAGTTVIVSEVTVYE